ncbi:MULTISPECIES: DUF4073 domain-containing protein [Clostridium]|uniref:DUF4073 domain-containing protein n=1 Tax=Clostridium frigoriphilum TaxID=443253 RepID=A0ABU7UJ84_9CLOT|nr:DUF4073 domain-containing protein [Clostridium sp. DSM 17811]MBU3098393.1 DUF4073 domain-containing protein [Clostridium sp. DSM 17811]
MTESIVNASAVTILPFRVVPYVRAIYANDTNRLTTRDGYPGVAAGYYEAVKIYAATGLVNGAPYIKTFAGYTKEQIALALASGWLTQQEHDETVNQMPSVIQTPAAPTVTLDDINNIIIGINSTMEYAINGVASYTVYNATTPPNLKGDNTVNVRISAIEGVNNASLDTTLVFTVNSVTPDAPLVTMDDVENKVIGMGVGMEFSIDNSAYVAYDPITFDMLDFSGEHTLLVRVASEGVNPVSLDTTLVFTTNVVTS